jgi:hypothetical protein
MLLDLQLRYRKGDRTVNSMVGLNILAELRHHQWFYGTIIVLTISKAAAAMAICAREHRSRRRWRYGCDDGRPVAGKMGGLSK